MSASHKANYQYQSMASSSPVGRNRAIDPKKQMEFELRSRYSCPLGPSMVDDTPKRRFSYTSLIYSHLNDSSTTEEQNIGLVKAISRAKVLMIKFESQIHTKSLKERDVNFVTSKKKADTNNQFAVGKAQVAHPLDQNNVVCSLNRVRKRRFSISYIDMPNMPKKHERSRSMSMFNRQMPNSPRGSNSMMKSIREFRAVSTKVQGTSKTTDSLEFGSSKKCMVGESVNSLSSNIGEDRWRLGNSTQLSDQSEKGWNLVRSSIRSSFSFPSISETELLRDFQVGNETLALKSSSQVSNIFFGRGKK